MHAIYRLTEEGNITIRPLGHVRSPVKQQRTGGFREVEAQLVLDPEFEPLLRGLEEFSHLMVVFWMSEIQEYSGQRRPQGREDVPVVGMLASR